MDDEEVFVGEYFVNSFSTEKRKMDQFYQGYPVEVRGYIEEPKGKKKNFGKKQDRHMHMRIYHEGRAFGRLHDDEVRILMPLIDEDLIRVDFFLHDFPLFTDTFKPLTLKATVFFRKKIITEPIVESFDPNEQDKERVHQISGLLTKLSLPLIVEPLIKGKSKYIRNNTKK